MSAGARRPSAAEPAKLAAEQAALRRVATLVARAAPPPAVFAAVAEEVGTVLGVDFTLVNRYDAEHGAEVVGAWARNGNTLLGRRMALGGRNISTLVIRGRRPAHIARYTDDGSPLATAAHEVGIRSSAGAPISVAGRLWGVMLAASERAGGVAAGTEQRLAEFTDLVATAIANAQAREELSALVGEQAALRRVATLVARGEPPAVMFGAVAEEVGQLVAADITLVSRFEPDGTLVDVGGWDAERESVPLGTRLTVGGDNVTARVLATGRAARLASYEHASGAAADDARARGIRSAVAAPITVAGRVWGVVLVASRSDVALPPGTESRLTGFTELAATAIANTEAREELQCVADEQAALRWVATLVARAAAPADVLSAIAEEAGRLLSADSTFLARYEGEHGLTLVAGWSAEGSTLRNGQHRARQEAIAARAVRDTGRPARVDSPARPESGVRSLVAVPIAVDGRLWGMMSVASAGEPPLAPATEARLARFSALAATAIANAEAHRQLTASRARIVVAADETRRRIQRDLHDGAQQGLVSVALELRAACAMVPPRLGELVADLQGAAAELDDTITELRELARGIHPAILAEGGLGVALETLARRSPVPVELAVHIEGRLAERLEVAAYYVISEALTNAAKHAHAATVRVEVGTAGGLLRVSVRDDGRGGAALDAGSGLMGLKDRVEALGGRMSLRSPVAAGTHLCVELPDGAAQPAGA